YAKTLETSGLSTKQLTNANLTTSESFGDLSAKVGLSAQTVQDYAAMVGISADKVAAGALTNKQLATAALGVSNAYRTATQTGSGFLDTLN
ncbi:hypothetical protein, partial [Escherichia coli]|uniref:hypothetical protein n=1 Tax=Escherichia coli TaxID=562 RepID=UPI00193245A0